MCRLSREILTPNDRGLLDAIVDVMERPMPAAVTAGRT